MTPYWKVYGAFLSKTLEDEWGQWMPEETEADMRMILEGAIPYFKFPRVSLERNEEGFVEDLTPQEIQILSVYMKCEWLNRSIMTWENVKPLYEERDFSQANLLDKLKSPNMNFDKIANKSGSIIEINNQKIGIYKNPEETDND